MMLSRVISLGCAGFEPQELEDPVQLEWVPGSMETTTWGTESAYALRACFLSNRSQFLCRAMLPALFHLMNSSATGCGTRPWARTVRCRSEPFLWCTPASSSRWCVWAVAWTRNLASEVIAAGTAVKWWPLGLFWR
ncbi:unnamed protein product [Prorocentrum cordatum]|uniref:Uncharacterized protein n=1 Tax=Prorocentrum cordatum TaxID=2364126 RepID=A0ABN9TUE9_9DINO|nr:unnamed protein product [Polarella glacialis]